MPTTDVNSLTTPETTSPPSVAEDLFAAFQTLLSSKGPVQFFANNTDRANAYTRLGFSPPIGTICYRADAAVHEFYNGTGVPTLAASWTTVLPIGAGLNSAVTAGSTASATYVDMTAPNSFTLVKLNGNTAVKVELHMTCYSSIANTTIRFGVQINGVDYDICQLLFNTANQHSQVSGVRRITGIPAGTYAVKGRIRVVSGTGTITITTDDWLSLYGEEVQ